MEANYYGVRQGRFDFKVDPDNGCFIGPDGGHHDTEQDAMYFDQLELCGCGNPPAVHRFLCDCLQRFDRDAVGWSEGSGVAGIMEVVKANPKVAAEFIGHFLDQKFLLDHGGSVYGSWLTARGKQFLEIGPISND